MAFAGDPTSVGTRAQGGAVTVRRETGALVTQVRSNTRVVIGEKRKYGLPGFDRGDVPGLGCLIVIWGQEKTR